MPTKQSIPELAATLPQPFVHAILGRVDDYCAYLTRMEGSYKFHTHERDEMYLVLEGEIEVRFDDGRSEILEPLRTLVVQHGEIHQTVATKPALVLIFKAADLFAE